jgi:hypothetical protein
MILRTANNFIDSLRANARDTSAERWTDAELWTMLNDAIYDWDGRVSFPAVHSIGYIDTDTEITLPYYIKGDVEPQHRDYANYDTSGFQYDISGEEVWKLIPMYELLENQDGVRTLVVPASTRYTGLQLVYWATNGPFPYVDADVPSGGWTSSATSLTVDVSADEPVPDVGYIKCGTEYMFYAGVTYGSGTVTLSNVERGVYNSTAATHSADAVVYWCIAAPNSSLFTQLRDACMSRLHAAFITDASPKETELHTYMMRWYTQQAQDYWRRYKPTKRHHSHLTMRGRVRRRLHDAD